MKLVKFTSFSISGKAVAVNPVHVVSVTEWPGCTTVMTTQGEIKVQESMDVVLERLTAVSE